MSEPNLYPIGTAGQPWGDAERAQWLAAQCVQRSYREEVIAKLQDPGEAFELCSMESWTIPTTVTH